MTEEEPGGEESERRSSGSEVVFPRRKQKSFSPSFLLRVPVNFSLCVVPNVIPRPTQCIPDSLHHLLIAFCFIRF